MTTLTTTTTQLSEEGKEQALQSYQELQDKEAMKNNAVREYIEEAKSSLIFQYNWEELLGAAPMAINLIGACYIAASSPPGLSTTLTPPEKGFKHLSYTTLRANLIECGDIGAKAFQYTKPQMSHIQMVSGKVFKHVNQVIVALGDGPEAKDVLQISMGELRKGAADCAKTAIAIDERFSHWLDYVCELHQVAVQNESTVSAKRLANETQLAAKQSMYEMTEEARKSASDAVVVLKESLSIAQEAYKKASDEFPSGWDLVGQQMVSSLAETVNNALNQAIPALMSNINPVAKVQAGVNMFNDTIHGGGSGAGAAKPSTAATGTAAPDPQVLPPDYTDPAYTVVTTVTEPFNVLISILTGGPDGGIDWDSVKASSKDPKTGLTYCKEMLKFSLKSFKASRNEPSIMLNEALKSSIKVAIELETEAKGASLNWNPPAEDSKKVKNWHKAIETANSSITVIAATASSTSRSRPPLINPGNGSESATQAKGALASTILNGASTRVAKTQEMYQSSENNYQKSTAKLVEITSAMAEISFELSKLKSEKITMTEVKVILTKCIEALVSLKAQIRKLVNFFKALAEIVKFVEEYHVQPFLKTIDMITDKKETGINGFTYIDMQRQILFNAAIMVRSYFSLFRDIAYMYVLSTESLDEGFNLIDELSQEVAGTNVDVIEQKQARLNKWSTAATKKIKTIVTEKQNEIKGGMEKRANEIANDTKALPPLPPKQKQLIGKGAKVVTDAAAKGMADYNPPVTRSFSSTKRLMAPVDD